MAYTRKLLMWYLVLLFTIHTCNSQCKPVRMCEKVFLSLGTDCKQNYALDGYVLESLSSIPNWQVCQNRCLKNCQCLSFNFKEIATTGNCELNDANTKLAPEALKEKEGVSYYEPARSYNSENVVSIFQLEFILGPKMRILLN